MPQTCPSPQLCVSLSAFCWVLLIFTDVVYYFPWLCFFLLLSMAVFFASFVHTLPSEVFPSFLASCSLHFVSPFLFPPVAFSPASLLLKPPSILLTLILGGCLPVSPRTQPRSAVLPPQMLSRGPWYSLCSQRLLACVLPGFTSAWHNKALSWAMQISGLWSLIGRHFSFWRSAIDACGCSFGYERAKENSLYEESLRHPSFRWPKTVLLNHRLTHKSTVFKP